MPVAGRRGEREVLRLSGALRRQTADSAAAEAMALAVAAIVLAAGVEAAQPGAMMPAFAGPGQPHPWRRRGRCRRR